MINMNFFNDKNVFFLICCDFLMKLYILFKTKLYIFSKEEPIKTQKRDR